MNTQKDHEAYLIKENERLRKAIEKADLLNDAMLTALLHAEDSLRMYESLMSAERIVVCKHDRD